MSYYIYYQKRGRSYESNKKKKKKKKKRHRKDTRKIQDQGNQTKNKEDIRKTEFDTMSLFLELKGKPTDSQKKGNQTSEKKIIMEK